MSNKFTYEVGTFVAVRNNEEADRETFWIGKILAVNRKYTSPGLILKVHWFAQSDGLNRF